MTKLADLIWKNAELLRGAYKENEYRTTSGRVARQTPFMVYDIVEVEGQRIAVSSPWLHQWQVLDDRISLGQYHQVYAFSQLLRDTIRFQTN